MATPINLASASPEIIKAWCKSIKVDCLNDLFKSNKIEAAHFFVNSKDAANARKTMLSELGINALQIAAINKNIETTEAIFEYDEAVEEPSAKEPDNKKQKFITDPADIEGSYHPALFALTKRVAEATGGTPLSSKVHLKDVPIFVEQCQDTVSLNNAATAVVHSEVSYHGTLELVVPRTKALKAYTFALEIYTDDPSQENKELRDVALKVYNTSMGPMECCTVTTGPGSGGSGGSDGPMAIMGSKYADVIGSVVRVGILLRFLDYSETEFRDQTGHVTHVSKKSKISPKHFSEWQRNRKP